MSLEYNISKNGENINIALNSSVNVSIKLEVLYSLCLALFSNPIPKYSVLNCEINSLKEHISI